MTHKTMFLFYLLFLFFSADKAVLSAEKIVDLNMTVDANKWTGIKLSNLNKGTLLYTDIKISGYADVLLVNSRTYTGFPGTKKDALFRSSTYDKLDFSITIPEAGDYVLIIDNRKGKQELSFALHIKASLDIKPTTSSIPTTISTKTNQQLSQLSAKLQQVFIFDDIDIQLVKCGKANAYSNETTVFLCAELIQKLLQKVEDKKKVKQLIFFTLLHEIGHVLMKQWNYPLYKNEEAADQFATVLLIMLSQTDVAKVQADFFSSVSPDLEYEQKIKKDVKHPLSIQRARNIRRWLDDPGVVKEWQPIFIPQMQTSFLKKLQNQPQWWTDLGLLKSELGTR